MNSKSRMRSLEAAVGRLERAAGRGPKYCAFCRYIRAAAPRPNTPEEEVLRTDCEFCGSRYAIHLRLSNEDLDVARMYFSFTLEDRFTDPKAHALTLRCTYKLGRAETERRGAALGRGTSRDPLARAGAKLWEDADILIDRRLGRLRAKYDDPFPEHSQLIASVEERERAKRDTSVFAPGLKELWRERTDYLICCELEKIIWGGTRPETEAAVEMLSLEMDELVKAYAEAEERRREESRVKNMELINSLRAQQGLPPQPKNYG
jgi:hypothetical protein